MRETKEADMRLTVLGSGSCELRRERSSPAYLVQAGDTALMLDLGQGAWRRLMETGFAPKDLAGVLISHHHLDHISDLLPLLFALNYDPGLSQEARITLAGHIGLAQVFEGLEGIFGQWVQPPPQVFSKRFIEPGQELDLGGIHIRTAPAKHMETSLSYRLEREGRCLVYLGDSEATDGLADFAQGADVLVAHCAANDQDPKPGHLHPQASGRLAARAQVGTLLLSHLYQVVDVPAALASAQAEFPGRVLAAEDLMLLDC